MDGLRWVLLLFGALVIVGVFLYSRRERSTSENSKPASGRREAAPTVDRREPSFGEEVDVPPGDEADFAMGEPVLGADDPPSIDSEEPAEEAPPAPQKIVTLRIVTGDKRPFAGDELILSLRGIGMRHGRFGIFHRYDGNDEDRVVFSAASLVEPGSFDLENIKEQQIPGISLFMVLPGPLEGAEAFDLMMAASRTLTQSLQAELLDESGSTLSIQRERYLREEIIQFQHGNLVA